MRTVPRPSVLLIEPDPDSLEMYSHYLSLSGFDVVATGDGEDALSRAVSADVVVTGIRVPALDGVDLVRRLRQDERTKNKVLIILTACAERHRAEAAGCDAFLLKPCLPDLLVSEIRRALALRSVPRTRALHTKQHQTKSRPRVA